MLARTAEFVESTNVAVSPLAAAVISRRIPVMSRAIAA